MSGLRNREPPIVLGHDYMVAIAGYRVSLQPADFRNRESRFSSYAHDTPVYVIKEISDICLKSNNR